VLACLLPLCVALCKRHSLMRQGDCRVPKCCWGYCSSCCAAEQVCQYTAPAVSISVQTKLGSTHTDNVYTDLIMYSSTTCTAREDKKST
jgi:hypothetical protein